MNANEKLKILMEIKSNNLHNEKEKKQYDIIKKLLMNESCFFQMRTETAIGILEFLGVPQNEMLEMYKELISEKNYADCIPKERYIIEKQK